MTEKGLLSLIKKAGAVALALTAILTLVFLLFPGLKPSKPDSPSGAAGGSPGAISGVAGVCSGEGGSAAVQAYALSIAYPESLPQYVASHAAIFAPDGAAIQCLTFLMATLESTPPDSASLAEAGIPRELLNAWAGGAEVEAAFVSRTPPELQLRGLITALPGLSAGDSAVYRRTPFYIRSVKNWRLVEIASTSDTTSGRIANLERQSVFNRLTRAAADSAGQF